MLLLRSHRKESDVNALLHANRSDCTCTLAQIFCIQSRVLIAIEGELKRTICSASAYLISCFSLAIRTVVPSSC
jgi:hypothetical protein